MGRGGTDRQAPGQEPPPDILTEGLMIISVPFDLICPLTENLRDMEWHPDWFDLGREGFIEKVKGSSKRLAEELDL